MTGTSWSVPSSRRLEAERSLPPSWEEVRHSRPPARDDLRGLDPGGSEPSPGLAFAAAAAARSSWCTWRKQRT